jgi:hypothetical protein
MKKLLYIFLCIPFIWLYQQQGTVNPFAIKGPEFLIFYLSLWVLSFSSIIINRPITNRSILASTYFSVQNIVLATVYLLGLIRLIRGIYLGRPVGYLVLILIAAFILSISMVQRKEANG